MMKHRCRAPTASCISRETVGGTGAVAEGGGLLRRIEVQSTPGTRAARSVRRGLRRWAGPEGGGGSMPSVQEDGPLGPGVSDEAHEPGGPPSPGGG
jgi:hypothetical protein